ncbi:hypothetical protein RRG08_013364 [Elysia crispata]|uniref:Uncharacterized protein n=1 Tax=Elysia crispata TaxID=231223 RepID=A0AAE1AXS6_9GAST|nr:hypothetical protein RRG08_013364 [Elysia crispata]
MVLVLDLLTNLDIPGVESLLEQRPTVNHSESRTVRTCAAESRERFAVVPEPSSHTWPGAACRVVYSRHGEPLTSSPKRK